MPNSSPESVPVESTLSTFKKLITTNKTGEWPVEAVIHKLMEDINSQYECFDIPKGRGKTRRIEAPTEELKFLQREMNDLLGRAHLPKGVYGFRRGMGAYKGLRKMLHGVGRSQNETGNLVSVYQTDIEDFFPSVTREQVQEAVYGFLIRTIHRWKKGPKLPEEMVRNLTDMITDLCCFKGRLPQGAPTSPMLANLVGARFDRAIRNMFIDQGKIDTMEYGRYADDIVIMGTETMPKEFRGLVESIVKSCGFSIAHQKTEYKQEKDRYEIWGVEVFPAQTEKGIGLRFKLPARMDREWAAEILEMINKEGAEALPMDPAALLTDRRFQQMLGRLSHGYAVTKFGTEKERTFGTGKDENILCLPPRLAHAWQCVIKKYGKILPQTHRSWFTKYELEYEKVVNHDPVSTEDDAFPELFDKRLDIMASRRNISGATVKAAIEEEKKRLLQLFPIRDEDGVQCNEEDEYAETSLAEELEEFIEATSDIPAGELNEKVLQQVIRCSAFACLMHEGRNVKDEKGFHGFHGSEDRESVLPTDIAIQYDAMRNKLIDGKHSDAALGLKYLFWDKEKKVDYEITRTDKIDGHGLQSQFLSFPGFPKKKKK